MSDVKKTDINSTIDSGIEDNVPKSSNLKNQLLALEPRILFDGAVVATVVEVAEVVDAGQSDQPINSEQVADDSALLDALSGTGQESEQRREIAFVDTGVENYQSILAAIGDNIEIVLLDNTGDGVEQITSVLTARSDIDAIHIISHGRSGTLDLGTAKLTEVSMAGKYADELAIIAQSLDESGDILIYGCDFGQYARGLSAVEALATATGADVAASNDLTGAENLGGDWDLEVTSGAIETQELTGGHFDGLLAPFQISVTGNPTIVTLAGNDVGHHVVYENAGTVGGTPIDLHGTVSAVTGNATVIFTSAGDDPRVEVTNNGTDVRSATIVWEVFEAGTSNVAFGDVTFDIQDIDGVGGNPFTREGVEAIGATSYTVSDPTNQQVTYTGAGFESVGTQNESNGETSRVAFDWANVSSWSIKYNSYEGINSHYNNDGDGDLSFSSPQTTTLISIDADNDGVINANDLDNDNDGILDVDETGNVYTTAWLDAVGNEAVRSYATRTDLANETNFTGVTSGNPLGGSGENQSTGWVTGWRIQGIMYDPGSDKFLAAWIDAFGREVINSYDTQADLGNNANGTTISSDITVGGGTLQSQSESWTTGWRRQGIMYDPVGQKYVASWLSATGQESMAIYDTLADFVNHLNPTFVETNANPFLGAGENQSESWLNGWRRQGITYDYETSTYVAAWLDAIGHEQVYSYASLVDMADHTNGTAIFTNGNPRGGQNENQSESWNTGWRRQGIMYDPSKIDPDGDGILNQFDLDSDNDGISDLIESGQDASVVDTNNDGRHDGGVAGNGVATAAGGGATPVNTDGTGPADYLDLDSDDDGIADAVEARPTAGYVSSTHVNNATNNGVNDDGLYVPVNTDGVADGADYIDTDSDEDGVLDSAESGLTPGADANSDGIGDGVGSSYADPDGNVNNPSADLANGVGDTSEVGYREVLDTDGDGIADTTDLDDDNDGILDSVENANDKVFLVDDGGAIYEFPTLNDFYNQTNSVLLATRPSYIGNRDIFTVGEKVINVTQNGEVFEFPTLADFVAETNRSFLGIHANYGNDVGFFNIGDKVYLVDDTGGIYEFPTLNDFANQTNGVLLGTRPNYAGFTGNYWRGGERNCYWSGAWIVGQPGSATGPYCWKKSAVYCPWIDL